MMKDKNLFRILVILLFLFIGQKGMSFAQGAGNNPVKNPMKNIIVFNPKEQTENPSPFSRQLLAALRDLKYPASMADEKQLDVFLARPKESSRLLILIDAGALSPQLRHAVDQYLEQGGDLLLVGNPPEGLTQGNPLGGVTGRYFTYGAREGDQATPLLSPSAHLTLSGLPGPLTAATAFPQGKAANAESLSLNFGRWINWLPMQSGEVPLPGSLASTWISGKKSQPDQVSILSHLGISGQFSNLKMLEKLLDPILSYYEAGITLLNAGPSAFHFSPEEEKSWGGRMLNRSAIPQQVSVKYQLKKTGTGKIASGGGRILDLPPEQAVDWKEAITPKPVEEGDYLLQIDVRDHDRKLVDRQFSRFSVTKLKPVSSQQAVTTKNGHFMLNGHPWFFRGVHYWLPQVVGQPDAKMWLEYLMPAFYNPDQVESDLRAMVAGGMNSVVVPYRDIREASALKDFLVRCERQGLRAMVFIENAHPLKFDLARLRAMILAAELDKQPALFALDLAWEPHLGYEKDRQVLNAAWRKWIDSQYASIAAAESIWKFSISRDSGSVRGPTDDELMEDGPWKVMVAAYRRFLDDQISLGYGEVTRAVRALCPNILLGARTGYGGTGHFSEIDRRVPFDLVSGADHLDYISPEAYGLQGDWNGFQDGFLITEAARYAGRYAKPVVWMEYGKSALKVGSATWSPQELNLKDQADYYQNMARLIKETQADGAFAWWWVGGYRSGERSDFGLMDITGTPRPAFRVLADTGQPSGIAWKPNTWISIDRDLHPRGLSMLIRSNRENFLQLRGEGKRVGFSSSYDQLTTENFPLVGVGNAEYHGTGPIKGLNGEIYQVEITVPAPSSPAAQNTGVPLKIRLHVLNTGRVTWSSDPASGGCVTVELVAHGKTIARKPISKDIPGGSDGYEEFMLRERLPPGPFILTLTSKRTGRFGLPATFEADTIKEKTAFQTSGPWKPVTDVRADIAIVYGTNDQMDLTFEQRVKSWRDRGYTTHFMTGIAWGGYQDYFTGEWDGKNHLDEGQVDVKGNTIWHSGKTVPYTVPTGSYIKYIKEKHIKRVIDAGIDAIYLEEPEFWARAGYSPAFKEEWQKYYNSAWRPQHESPENTYLSNKLKYHLYYNALNEVFTFAKEYGKSKGMNVRCYVPTHSLVSYSAIQMISPESSLASLSCVDGYIAQVWTGTARVPTFFNGVRKERVFENAFLEYGSMESMTAPTGRKMFFLTDPVEDRARDWGDYKKNYQATFTAQLLYPTIADYQVMPWPDRIYQGLYRKPDSEEKETIPRYYSTQMQVMINSLNQMPLSDNQVNGAPGIRVLMANSLMFQRFPTHNGYEDPQLSNFYGQALPLLKRGVPVKTLHIENAAYPGTWKDTKLLVMSYSNMKPLAPEAHKYIAQWVKDGGVLIYCGRDNDPFQMVKEWWNTGDNHYQTPSEHLFEQLGIDRVAKEGEYRYGKGTVFVLRQDPKEFVLQADNDKGFVATVKQLYEQNAKAGTLTFKNYFYLERGPFDLAAVMDESVSGEPFRIKGCLIDLFDPKLPVLTEKIVMPGEQAYLYDIGRVPDPHRPQVLAGAARVYNEATGKKKYSFTAKSPLNTTNAMRVLLPVAPKKTTVTDSSGQVLPGIQSVWDETSKTCFLSFENHPDGINVEFQW